MVFFLFHFELRFRFAYFTFVKILSKYAMVPRLPRGTVHRFWTEQVPNHRHYRVQYVLDLYCRFKAN